MAVGVGFRACPAWPRLIHPLGPVAATHCVAAFLVLLMGLGQSDPDSVRELSQVTSKMGPFSLQDGSLSQRHNAPNLVYLIYQIGPVSGLQAA